VSVPRISAFARLANGNVGPVRVIEGQATKLSRTMHGIAYDSVNDEIIVPVALAGAVLVFKGDATGEEPPARIIQGTRTRLIRPQTVAVDPQHDEILTADPSARSIMVFSRTANGDLAPIRTIGGPNTKLVDIVGVAVDPVRNLIVASSRTGSGTTGLFVFNRTDDGDVAPRASIAGSRTRLAHFRQVAIDSDLGRIYLAEQSQKMASRKAYNLDQLSAEFTKEDEDEPRRRNDASVGFIAVWDVNDDGNLPPRAIIKGPSSRLLGPGGVAINPKDSEVYAVDGGSNAVYSFFLPQFFRRPLEAATGR
jgi:DNA-binding beta-propeller fold protein YncE